MEQAASILQHVEQPLQLAALALLVLYGIAKVLIGTGKWTPSDAVVRLFLDRAFLLGLVALVLAVGGPLLLRGINPDQFISGSVYAQNGAPVGDATVNIVPGGSQAVHLDGTFEFRVPEHLKRDQYVITATADGYKASTRTVPKAALGSVDFQLEPQPVHAVLQIMPEITVGQFYGLPTLVVSMQVKSPGSAQVFVTDMTAQLSSGSVSVDLRPQFVTIVGPMGPFAPIAGPIPILQGPQLTLRLVLSPNADINGLVRSIAGLPDYRGSAPCSPSGDGSVGPLTDRAYEMIRSFARSRFIWSEGDWTLHFGITVGGQVDTFDKTFRMSQADVQHLQDSISLTKSCQSVSGATPLAQDGQMSNYIVR